MGRLPPLVPAVLTLTLPGIALRLGLWTAAPLMGAAAAGLGIAAATAAMLWALLQPRQADPRGWPLVLLPFAAMAPELLIDTYHVWGGRAIEGTAETSPMLAAMTGSSGLLVGLGWPLLILVFWLRNHQQALRLSSDQAIELSSIFLVVLYSFTIFIRGYLWPFDAPILIMLFIIYLWRGTRSRGKASWFEAPVVTPRHFSFFRRLFVFSLLVVPVVATILVAGPFSESLRGISSGAGWQHFELLQLSFPVTSKLPLIIGVMMLAWQHRTSLATLSLLLSHMGLWTLLVAALPIMLSLHELMAGGSTMLAFDDHQRAELMLAASQSLYALALMASLSLSWKTALAMLLPFEAQWLLSAFYPDGGSLVPQGVFSVFYLGAAVAIMVLQRQRLQVLAGVAPATEGEHYAVEAGTPQREALSQR